LITAVVVGIAAIGITFMFSYGNTWVVAKGDDRVALGLAQQQIEQRRALGAVDWINNLDTCCTINDSPQTASGVPSDRTFNRIICIQYVSDTNVSSPAYVVVPPNYTACAGGAATNTKRITVVVWSAQSANQLYADPPVILQAWITNTPGGI
jgi:type II secretory pathway pseudopilin PulG